jgi:putative transposase
MPWKEDTKLGQRHRLVLAMIRAEAPVAELCREAGVSRQTAYKYRKRYDQHGRAGLADQKRGRLSDSGYAKVRSRLLALRRQRPSWGARKLLHQLHRVQPRWALPCERLVQRWLHAAGLAHRRRRQRAGGGVGTQMPPAPHSNALWTGDFKGWFRTRSGRKVHPLTVRDHYSKCLLCVEPMRRLNEASLRRIFARLFRRHGRPKAILTDRGAPFCGTGPHGLTKLSLWWHRLGIQVLFVDRKRGLHNNAHEQMHRVLKAEVKVMDSLRQQQRELERWRRDYNTVRLHEVIGRSPAELYQSQPGPLPRLHTPRYPAHWPVHAVKGKGEIVFRRHRYGIGRTFAGLRVGLQPIGPATFHVYFDSLSLGLIKLQNTSSSSGKGGSKAPSLNPPHLYRSLLQTKTVSD